MPEDESGELNFNEAEQELFQRGFKYKAKYIGTMEVPRPISRLEIVSAMRRIRYDFKSRSVKKKPIELVVNLSGVSVTLTDFKFKKNTDTCEATLLFKNPIHRIFYVSHDSKDVKIFSYIAKEDDSNVFKCSVFKAIKKKEAGEIVKTIGQAFEVSHIAHQIKKQKEEQMLLQKQQLEKQYEKLDEVKNALHSESFSGKPADHLSPNSSPSVKEIQSDPELETKVEYEGGLDSATCQSHEKTAIKQKLKMKCEENMFIKSQNKILQRQLQVEMQARKQAEILAERLISQNKELLSQVDTLVKKLNSFEKSAQSRTRTLDLSLISQDNTNKMLDSKNSPDSGLNEMDSCQSENNIEEASQGRGGIENAAIESTPVKKRESKEEKNNKEISNSNTQNYTLKNQINWKNKNVKSKHLSLSISLYNKLNSKLSSSFGSRSSKNIDKVDFNQFHCQSVTAAEKNSEQTKLLNKSNKKFKIDKMINLRKNLGDSTTELELSFED